MKKYFIFLFIWTSCFALPTYFTYSKPSGSSEYVITTESLDKWNNIFKDLLKKHENEISDDHAFSFFSYLYIAERDAAFLSYNTQGCFEGSLDPLVVQIATLFYPKYQLPADYERDPYSEELASIVFEKFKARYIENEKNRWLLWYPSDYKVPAPPEKVEREIKKFHKMRRSMNKKEGATAAEWEKIAIPECKNWISICNDYIHENHVDLGRQLQVRAVLMLSLSDADSIAMAAKLKYNTPRPYQIETDLVPLIKQPRSPSYPSGHAALAGAGAEVMCSFFPDESKEWIRLARECAYSRIWGGVHYPMDVTEGLTIGRETAKEIISKQ